MALMAAALAALSGCAALTSGESAPAADRTAAVPPAGPALQAVAGAAPGERLNVDDPALGGPVEVDVLSEYDAASGRRCKRVAIRAAAGGYGARVACAAASGWYWSQASIT